MYYKTYSSISELSNDIDVIIAQADVEAGADVTDDISYLTSTLDIVTSFTSFINSYTIADNEFKAASVNGTEEIFYFDSDYSLNMEADGGNYVINEFNSIENNITGIKIDNNLLSGQTLQTQVFNLGCGTISSLGKQ